MKTHIETLLYTTTPSRTTIIIWYNDVIILIHNLLLVHQSYLLSQIQQSLLQMKFPPCHNSPDYIACDRLPLDLQNWHDRYSTSTAVLLYGIGRAHAWLNDAAFFFCHIHFTVQALAEIVQLKKVANFSGSEHHIAMNIDFVIELIAGHCIQLRLLLSLSPRVDLNFHCWQLVK